MTATEAPVAKEVPDSEVRARLELQAEAQAPRREVALLETAEAQALPREEAAAPPRQNVSLGFVTTSPVMKSTTPSGE